MNNIWKYSLVLAFSIILDQLVKGTAQSLIPSEGGVVDLFGPLSFVRIRNENLIFGLPLPLITSYANALAIISSSSLILWSLKRVVINRNVNPLKGWAYTLFLTGLFTSWMDRATQGFTLDYLGIEILGSLIPFSIGDLYFLIGMVLIASLEVKGRIS